MKLMYLKGGIEMINEGKIKIIQFEFNEMNIVSRVFLTDFIIHSHNYDIFRLLGIHLLAITNYNTVIYEIFQISKSDGNS